jgi:hypothetical protein
LRFRYGVADRRPKLAAAQQAATPTSPNRRPDALARSGRLTTGGHTGEDLFLYHHGLDGRSMWNTGIAHLSAALASTSPR